MSIDDKAVDATNIWMNTANRPSLRQIIQYYEIAKATHQPDELTKCPKCGGPADNGHDRCLPPNPYYCTKCTATQGEVAHWSEQSTHNGLADGSIPSLPTTDALAIARDIARPAKEMARDALVVALPAIEHLLKECSPKRESGWQPIKTIPWAGPVWVYSEDAGVLIGNWRPKDEEIVSADGYAVIRNCLLWKPLDKPAAPTKEEQGRRG